jgi:hypothetical protein
MAQTDGSIKVDEISTCFALRIKKKLMKKDVEIFSYMCSKSGTNTLTNLRRHS